MLRIHGNNLIPLWAELSTTTSRQICPRIWKWFEGCCSQSKLIDSILPMCALDIFCSLDKFFFGTLHCFEKFSILALSLLWNIIRHASGSNYTLVHHLLRLLVEGLLHHLRLLVEWLLHHLRLLVEWLLHHLRLHGGRHHWLRLIHRWRGLNWI